MAVALIVEDGTGIVGATSYVTLDEAKAYATSRGATVPADAALAPLLVRAMDYIEAQRARYSGVKTYGRGFAQWPRTDAAVDGQELDTDEIPGELKMAQCQAAIDLQAVDPLAVTSGPAIRQETVGPLTTIYAVGDNAGTAAAKMPKVDALLAPLFRSHGLSLSVERA